MLQAMQQSTIPTPASTVASFASLLAKLTITEAPELPASGRGDGFLPPGWKPAPAWNDDDLADDVATLSYEQAVHTHARYTATEPVAPSSTPSPAPPVRRPPAPLAAANSQPAGASVTHLERNLKDASITIRMSQAECAQLHQRAAEAGLTISAYLRSCTLEAESLRAMVKETMAQLRSKGAAKQEASTAASQPWRNRMARLFAPRRDGQRVAHG